LATIGAKTRHLQERGFEDGVSTRLLVYAAELIGHGIAPRRACEAALVQSISDEADLQQAVADIVDVVFP
jgi:nitric oxide reductase NorQ protein